MSAHTVRVFCDTLLRCGVAFVGGYRTSEGDSYDELLAGISKNWSRILSWVKQNMFRTTIL